MLQWVSALRQLASSCDYNEKTHEFIRDQVIEKASSSRVRQRLLMERSKLTLQKTLALLATALHNICIQGGGAGDWLPLMTRPSSRRTELAGPDGRSSSGGPGPRGATPSSASSQRRGHRYPQPSPLASVGRTAAGAISCVMYGVRGCHSDASLSLSVAAEGPTCTGTVIQSGYGTDWSVRLVQILLCAGCSSPFWLVT